MGGLRLWGYVHDPITWIDPFGLNVKTGKGRVHVKYTGYKSVDGKTLPYHGYASMPYDPKKPLPTADEVIANLYGNNFDDFVGGQTLSQTILGKILKGNKLLEV